MPPLPGPPPAMETNANPARQKPRQREGAASHSLRIAAKRKERPGTRSDNRTSFRPWLPGRGAVGASRSGDERQRRQGEAWTTLARGAKLTATAANRHERVTGPALASFAALQHRMSF